MVASALESIHREMSEPTNYMEQFLQQQGQTFTGIQENMQEQGNLLSGVNESLRALFEKIQKAPTGSSGDNSIDSKLFIPERDSARNDPWTVRTFVSSMDSHLALHKYSDKKKVQIFSSRLSGVARDWFDNFTRHRSGASYSTLVEEFKLRLFQPIGKAKWLPSVGTYEL